MFVLGRSMNTFPAFLHIPSACILETLPAILRIRQQAIQYSPSDRQHAKIGFPQRSGRIYCQGVRNRFLKNEACRVNYAHNVHLDWSVRLSGGMHHSTKGDGSPPFNNATQTTDSGAYLQ